MTAEASNRGLANAVIPTYSTGPIYPSERGLVNRTVSSLRRTNLHIMASGVRKTLYAREPMTLKQMRQQLVSGSFLPDANTTGVYDPLTLQMVTGNQTITTSNATFENKHYTGRIDVRATNVTFRNCLFTGPIGTPHAGGLLIATHQSQSGLLVEDCTFAPDVPSHITNCIEGHAMTLRRINSYHGVDLVSVIAPTGATRADVVIEGSWLHDPVMFNTSTQSDHLTHNDVIQWHGMLGLKVDGSRLEGWCAEGLGVVSTPPNEPWPPGSASFSGNPWYPNRWALGACVMSSPARAPLGEFEFTNNWCDGATTALNLARYDGTFPDCGVITGNRWGFDFRLGQNFVVIADAAQQMVLEGNHRWMAEDPWDASVPFNVRRHGGW